MSSDANVKSYGDRTIADVDVDFPLPARYFSGRSSKRHIP